MSRFKRMFLLYLFLLGGCGCSSTVMIQPQINGLVAAKKYNYALKLLEETPDGYGHKNRLLYLLDYGMALHIAGRYRDSINVFEEAKKEFDRLYTVSVSSQVTTWLVNDYSAPYRGEDFERVMINVFQALNYLALNEPAEALVEARDVDVKLTAINRQYDPSAQNVYREDAFVRFLMGVIQESFGTLESYNDALISYKKAVEIYQVDYSANYNVEVPLILKENILSVSQKYDKEDFVRYRAQFPGVSFMGFDEKKKKGEIILVQYSGLSPIKHQVSIPIPVPHGILAKMAFPIYDERTADRSVGIFKAVDSSGRQITAATQLGEDIGAIAVNNLNNRKLRVIAKALLRSGAKVTLEQLAARSIDRRQGGHSAEWFQYISSLYNLASEQADLRSWQTLPDQIYVSRLIVDPGDYDVSFNGDTLGHATVAPADTVFFVVRSEK